MANQIQATVYQIDGSPLNNSIQIAFLTSNVSMREFQTDLIPEVNSAIVYYPNTSNQLQEQTFLVSETITNLVTAANNGGTSQISTTVLEINQEPQIPNGITFSFPVQGISIWPVSDPIVGGVNSFLEFKNKKYYLLEDEDTLVTDANAGASLVQLESLTINYTDFVKTTNANGDNGLTITDSFTLIGANNPIDKIYFSVDVGGSNISSYYNNFQDGIDLDFGSRNFRIGGFNVGTTWIEINDNIERFTFNTEELFFTGAALEDSTPGTVATKALLITLNNTQYKINLY